MLMILLPECHGIRLGLLQADNGESNNEGTDQLYELTAP